MSKGARRKSKEKNEGFKVHKDIFDELILLNHEIPDVSHDTILNLYYVRGYSSREISKFMKSKGNKTDDDQTQNKIKPI